MRMTETFGRTLREAPADADGAGFRLLLRAGYLRSAGSNCYTYLPLGLRTLERMAAQLSVFGSGRRQAEILSRVCSCGGGDLAVIARSLAESDVQSYRQLPVSLFGTGVCENSHSQGRGGPLNAREAPVLLTITMDATEEAGQAAYIERQKALVDFCLRNGTQVVAAQDGPFSKEGAQATGNHVYLHLSGDGGQAALLCEGCGYAALADVAAFMRPPVEPEQPLPLEKVATPHTATITDLAQLLRVPESRTAKAVFLMASIDEGERFIFAVVRGDMDLSERKLCAATGASSVRPATDPEIRATGATPGYASPIGLKNVLIIADELVALSPNLVAGANEDGYHLLNTNYGRDYEAGMVSDIAAARPGDGCPRCGQPLQAAPVSVIGRSLRLPLSRNHPNYLDATGRAQPVSISVHQVDLGALLTMVAEKRRDEQGLLLTPSVAPFDVHLVAMPGAETEAPALFEALWAEGITCLWDDRSDSAGVKFTDADLIGLPLRITLGKRSLQAGGAEFKRRDRADKWVQALDSAVAAARDTLAAVEADAVAGKEELRYGEHLR